MNVAKKEEQAEKCEVVHETFIYVVEESNF